MSNFRYFQCTEAVPLNFSLEEMSVSIIEKDAGSLRIFCRVTVARFPQFYTEQNGEYVFFQETDRAVLAEASVEDRR